MPTVQDYRQIDVNDTYLAKGLRVIKPRERRIIEDNTILQLGKEINGFLISDNPDYNTIVDYCIDLGGVSHLSSKAIGELMSMSNKHKIARGRKLMIANVQPKIHQIFSRTALGQTHFDIHKTIEDCLN